MHVERAISTLLFRERVATSPHPFFTMNTRKRIMVDTNSFLITRMPTKVYYMYDVGERFLPRAPSQKFTCSTSYVFANTDVSRSSFLAHHQAEAKEEPHVPPPPDDREARDLQPAARVRRQRHCLLAWPAGSRREQRRHGTY